MTGDPLIGLVTTVRNADGSWSTRRSSSRAAVGAPGRPCPRVRSAWIATSGTVGIELFNGAVTHAPGASDQNLQPQLGGCCGYQPKLALDSCGPPLDRVVLQRDGRHGHVRAATRPRHGGTDRTARAGAQQRERQQQQLRVGALVCGDLPPRLRQLAGCRPDRHHRLLVAGAGTPTTIANLAGTGQSAGRVLAAAYRTDGRLWVAWFDGKSYRATLGDATGAGGVIEDAGVPKGAPNGAYGLAGISVGDNLLLAANYAWKDRVRRRNLSRCS